MIDTTQPSDIARETLRQLALRRIAPTADNYRALYHEIAGTPPDEIFPERALRQLAAALPRHNREALRIAQAAGTIPYTLLCGVTARVKRDVVPADGE